MNFIHTTFHPAAPSPFATLFRRTFFASVWHCQQHAAAAPKLKHVDSYARTRRIWSKDDSDKLVALVKEIGPKWTHISHILERPPSVIFNRYKMLTDTNEFHGPWTKQELKRLSELTSEKPVDEIDWEAVRLQMPRLRPAPILRLTYRHSIDPKIRHGTWTKEEVKRLQELIGIYGPENWDAIADGMGTRTRRQCLERWRWQQKTGLKKGRYTVEEDEAILAAVEKYGENFAQVKEAIGSERTARNISQHYRYALCPTTDRSPWTDEEEDAMYDLCNKYNHDMDRVKRETKVQRSVKDMWNHYYRAHRRKTGEHYGAKNEMLAIKKRQE